MGILVIDHDGIFLSVTLGDHFFLKAERVLDELYKKGVFVVLFFFKILIHLSELF